MGNSLPTNLIELAVADPRTFEAATVTTDDGREKVVGALATLSGLAEQYGLKPEEMDIVLDRIGKLADE